MLILSFDGGGVRGMLTAALLVRLESELPGWLNEVDLFAGASTGALIALGLAHGLTPVEVFEFYRNRLPEIFQSSWWRRYLSLWRAKYSNDALMSNLNEIFGDTKMGDLETDCLVATFYLGTTRDDPARAKFYSRKNPNIRIADAALWSSSAPTYFPSADRHVDGGLSANNTAVCAMAYAENNGTPLSDMSVLSLGTGRHSTVLEGGDRGLAYWGENLLIPFVDGAVDVAHYQARRFLEAEGNYHRVQPRLMEEIDLDDVNRLDDLIQIAASINLDPTVDWITQQVGPSNS